MDWLGKEIDFPSAPWRDWEWVARHYGGVGTGWQYWKWFDVGGGGEVGRAESGWLIWCPRLMAWLLAAPRVYDGEWRSPTQDAWAPKFPMH